MKLDRKLKEITSLIFTKFDRLLDLKLVRIHLGIEAVIRLQDYSEPPSASVYGAPRGNCFQCIDFWLDVFKMPLPK
jgi:hypothetical protein